MEINHKTNVKQMAQSLNGREAGNVISTQESLIAKGCGIAIVFATEDSLVFRGTTYQEMSSDKPSFINKSGVISENHSPESKSITPVFDPLVKIAWIKTEMDHELFNIMKKGKIVSQGIVFSTSDFRQ